MLHQEKSSKGKRLLFTTPSGKLMSLRNLSLHFYQVGSDRASKNPHPRLVSHGCNIASNSEGPSEDCARDVRSSTISLTLDTYSHILPDIQQETADKVDKIFGEV